MNVVDKVTIFVRLNNTSVFLVGTFNIRLQSHRSIILVRLSVIMLSVIILNVAAPMLNNQSKNFLQFQLLIRTLC